MSVRAVVMPNVALYHAPSRCRSATWSSVAMFAAVVLGGLTAESLYADIVVDPNNNGSTDVVQDPDVTAVLISNPVADPLNLGGDNLAVGDTAVGALSITTGGSVTNLDGIVGNQSGSTGTVLVNGPGSVWNNTRSLLLGILGDGTLTIENQASVNNDDGFISSNAGASGSVTVRGNGSSWINREGLWVGVRGTNADLQLIDGGSATSKDGIIANDSGSEGMATVSGANSTWEMAQSLLVGVSGNGSLRVENQGVVESVDGFIGDNLGSTGVMTVTGTGSEWTMTGDLTIAEFGTGTLNIEDGGTVRGAGLVDIGTAGTVNLVDGLLEVGEIDAISGAFSFTGGRLGASTFTGDLVQEGGLFSPANSLGATVVTGSYDLEMGQLEIGIGGLAQGTEFDLLRVMQDLSLVDSGLSVLLVDGFTLGLNQHFEVIQVAGSASGMFNGLAEGGLVGNFSGVDLFISYQAGDGNDVALYTIPEPSSAVLWLAGMIAFAACARLRATRRTSARQ